MFCILNEDKNYLMTIWDDIIGGEHIYPFEELNLGLIEYYNGSEHSELPLIFIDEEAGLCGSVLIRSLESDKNYKDLKLKCKNDVKVWLLEDIRLHVTGINTDFIYSSKVIALQMRFYKELKEACNKLMKICAIDKLITVSMDDKSHEFLKNYGEFTFTKEYSSENGIIGVIEKQLINIPLKGNVIPFRLYA